MPLIRHVKFAALQTDCYDVHVAKQDGIVDKNTNELTGLGIEVSVSDSSDPAAAAKHARLAWEAAQKASTAANEARAEAAAASALIAAATKNASEQNRKRPVKSEFLDPEEDLLEMEVNLSIQCPLAIVGKIEQAAKGKHCTHPQCFDLMSFILVSEQSSVWQCPVCLKPLPMKDIIVDDEMTKAIERCGEDITHLRRTADGKLTPVEPKDMKKRKKRKRESETEEIKQGWMDVLDSVPSVPRVPSPSKHLKSSEKSDTPASSSTGKGYGSSIDNAIVLD
eukprot:CAMPEP_0184496716 /NCGR_PEP_ID=MMETSP0113_2-20130426/34705_1 /TAXON_ID=91329 /ORGANISM="Norrisiella sphaerica, Strain BC52" /LENGTH=279 /DNA_ID=CAMNT_0026883481 /DNA_START=982 /DNA_END=1820 /DNA_ORIENTATION=+